jgi:ribosomal protein S18 acetylase RimI-like enzyme
MTGTASLTVRHAENRIWGLHVFLEATGDPEAIRDAYARADLEAALRIDRVIHDLQEASPSFASLPLDEATRRADWEERLGADEVSYFVAERDGDPVGHVTLYPENAATMNLVSTAVLPEAQGHGIGRALTSHALAFARESGYATVATNWRLTNLVASRFWPALGFRVTKLRLTRELPR